MFLQSWNLKIVGFQDSLGGGVAISSSVSESALEARTNLGISGRSSGSRTGAWMAGSAAHVAQCMSIFAGASAGCWCSSQCFAAAATGTAAGALAMPTGISASATSRMSLVTAAIMPGA
jgi:hypothetical protein